LHRGQHKDTRAFNIKASHAISPNTIHGEVLWFDNSYIAAVADVKDRLAALSLNAFYYVLPYSSTLLMHFIA